MESVCFVVFLNMRGKGFPESWRFWSFLAGHWRWHSPAHRRGCSTSCRWWDEPRLSDGTPPVRNMAILVQCTRHFKIWWVRFAQIYVTSICKSDQKVVFFFYRGLAFWWRILGCMSFACWRAMVMVLWKGAGSWWAAGTQKPGGGH